VIDNRRACAGFFALPGALIAAVLLHNQAT